MARALAGRVARRALASAASPGGGPPPSPSNPLRYGGPILPALPIGILSGSLGSIVGIGGALVAVPTTQAAYGLAQLQANSTALLLNVATCLSGAAVFASAGHVDPVAGILVASAATATAGPGARLAHTMDEKTRRMMFAGALLALAPVIALKTPAPDSGEDDADHDSESSSGRGQGGSADGAQGLAMPPLPKVGYYLALGAAVGAASGMLGIGAGTMMSVGLALAGGMSHKTMLGTSFVAQIGPGLSGAWAHHRLGNLRLDLVPALAVGAGLGSYAASGVAVDLPEAQLRAAFAAFIAGLGMHALRGALKMPKV